MTRVMVRRCAAIVALVAIVGVLSSLVFLDRGAGAKAAITPGSTLLHALRDPTGDGELSLGPGERLIDRTELAPASPVRREIVTFAQISDLHVVDDESPLRVEVLDRFGGSVTSAFRPQESLSTQVLAATEVSVNALHPSLVLVTGDLSDNAQHNELAWVLQTLRGGIVHPDSGRAGYDGVQSLSSADPFFYRPAIDSPRHPGLVDAAQRAFRAPGLRAPWIPVISNHDILVQGVVPAERQLVAIATGSRKLIALSPSAIDAVEQRTIDPGEIRRLLEGDRAGVYEHVPADPARRPYEPRQAVAAIAAASHVHLDDGRLVWTRRLARGVIAIGLDTADRHGGASGVLPPSELVWLRGRLAAEHGERIFIVSPTPLEDTSGGEAALALLDHTRGIVAVLAGDAHRSLVTPRRAAMGGYWLVRAPSLADFPQQARAYRLVQLRDGRVALETWMLDQAGRDGAPGFLGLAGISRDLAYLDPQGGRPKGDAGTRLDRNVRLFLP